ncbi:hypothetical protein [Edaphovirga cremea]|uniref:hypothetical protein n=1 Tax=Edaphovirga cremea TaxID=2267246 RepID=UPI000DEEB103|nr:hypothetical protein [Edaphovirga cremea]
MQAIRYFSRLIFLFTLLCSPTLWAANVPTAIDPWPHSVLLSGTEMMLHQPQLDSWQDNRLTGRMVVAVKTGTVTDTNGKPQDKISYGVAWFSTRSDTDKEQRLVTLDNIHVDKVNFPTDSSNQAHYLDLLQQLPQKTLTVSLDQLESDLAIQDKGPQQNVKVSNAPPQIIFAFQPATLVLLDGQPAWQATGQNGVERAINTRSLLLKKSGVLYIYFANEWYTATDLNGPWAQKMSVPIEVVNAMQASVKKDNVVTGPEGKNPITQPAEIHVATAPTELIQIDGDPQFIPIAGTQLSYISNTPSDVFIDANQNNNWYILVSGRWFHAESVKGPWQYVAGDELPADFVKIPSNSPKSAVLASIPGTPEAHEALIANAVPQTASVSRSKASLTVSYDGGTAKFKPITGTPLHYAWNTDVPVIEVDSHSYFAVKSGVWFSATSSHGPWTVATTIPAVIYTIPADSPLHYVTYVRIYGSTSDVVYVGYTPGYYGTVVSDGVVVYGTGYPCNAWVGDVWYSCPATYGYVSSFAWDPAIGWSFGFVSGWIWGSSWSNPWWGPWYGYYPPYHPGYWGGGVSVYNVYNHWGNTVAQGVRADWSNPWNGHYGSDVRGSFYNNATGGHGYGYAGRDINGYNGMTHAAAGGVRFNPQTGRAISANGAAVHNPDTGNGLAGGERNSVNANTGRATHSQSIAGNTPQGAGKTGSFTSVGADGVTHGSGYVHYDKETGQVTHGGVVNGPDHVYAGRDGNIYQYNNGNWQKMDASGNFVKGQPPAEVNNAQLARTRGTERQTERTQTLQSRPQVNQLQIQQHIPQDRGERLQQMHSFDRSNYVPRFQGRMGGRR